MIPTITLHSFKAFDIQEVIWNRPEMTDNQIEVKSILAGVCRSDIGSYARWEKMPYSDGINPEGILGTFGHESLAEVTRIGKNITGVEVGNLVACWSDPAFAEYFYAKQNEFVIVPEVSPKYILQPTICSVNIADKFMYSLYTKDMLHSDSEILLVGTGFMSVIIAQILKWKGLKVTVAGSSNKSIWEKLSIELIALESALASDKVYNGIIDLSSKASNFDKCIKLAATEATLCYASTPISPVSTNFFDACWKCVDIILPSPRNTNFQTMAYETLNLLEKRIIDIDGLWTNSYNRHNMVEVKKAFEDGVNRTPNYIRGYLDFRQK